MLAQPLEDEVTIRFEKQRVIVTLLSAKLKR